MLSWEHSEQSSWERSQLKRSERYTIFNSANRLTKSCELLHVAQSQKRLGPWGTLWDPRVHFGTLGYTLGTLWQTSETLGYTSESLGVHF
jgi:hypothetical protein